jgi:hypothetical protein
MVRMLSKRMLAVVLALALALPGAALAQSAGDEQYVDPFQDSQGQQQEQATPPSQESGSQGGDGTVEAPAETQVVPEAPPTASSTTGAPAVAGSETLPVTGLPAAALAVAGAFLVAAGATLRRRA